MVGVALTKSNARDFGSAPNVMRLFAIFFKHGKLQFAQYETKNSIIRDERKLNPFHLQKLSFEYMNMISHRPLFTQGAQ